MPEEKKRRRSRVLEYFEQKEAEPAEGEENPDGGGDNPFQDFDSAFGLDYFDSKGNE